jgi:ribosomal protein S18 acetylase RimI-like enzyme
VAGIAVARMTPDDAPLLHALRLEALAAHISLDRRRESLSRYYWLLARVDGEAAGICNFDHPVHNQKQKHVGHIGSMFVRTGYRGRGVADALLSAVFDHAATSDVQQILLTVTADNAPAIGLYERQGFQTVGRLPRSIHVGERYYDELQMYRDLCNRGA